YVDLHVCDKSINTYYPPVQK
uniref:Ribonuclease RCL2 peptide 2 n=1 Tax=Aquarana catesbeiana TaxID=8400 RepID=Q7LZ36_AQUCT